LNSASLLAADPVMQEGIVVSASAGKLEFKAKDGKQRSYQLEQTTKITINGKPGKLEDLKVGVPVKVATDADDKLLSIATVDEVKQIASPALPLARGMR
jgi:hypothetical protein